MKDDNEDEYHRKLCRFLYYTDKLEKNAIIGELKHTMDWYRESGYIKSIDDLFKCYQMTQAYMTMKYLEELKTDLIEESEKFDFNQTIITLTKYASILNLKGKYPTTLNQLHKIIESRFNQFKSQYNKQIYKILYDVFLESEIDMQKTIQ